MMIPRNFLSCLYALPSAVQVARLSGARTWIIDILKASRGQKAILEDGLGIMRAIPPGLIADFADKYHDPCFKIPDSKRKYFDLPVHLLRSVWQAHELGLHKEQRKLNILDMGMGFGYFILACEHMGHDVVGVDLGERTVYQDVVEKLDTRRRCRDWYITAEAPLPENIGKFDLITAFQTMFDYSPDGRLWDTEQWIIFFQFILPYLNDGGKIYIGNNTVDSANEKLFKKKNDFFSSSGAQKCMNGWLFNVEQLKKTFS